MPRTKQNNPKNLKGEFAPRSALCSEFPRQLVNVLMRMFEDEPFTTDVFFG